MTLGRLLVSLAAVGFFLLVLGSAIDQLPFVVAGSILVGYAVGFTTCRLIALKALEDLRGGS